MGKILIMNIIEAESHKSNSRVKRKTGTIRESLFKLKKEEIITKNIRNLKHKKAGERYWKKKLNKNFYASN